MIDAPGVLTGLILNMRQWKRHNALYDAEQFQIERNLAGTKACGKSDSTVAAEKQSHPEADSTSDDLKALNNPTKKKTIEI